MKFDVGTAKQEGRTEFPRLVLKKDEIARISILTTKDWEVSVRHFIQNLGYVHCLAIHKAKDEVDLLRIEDEGGRPDDCPLCKRFLEKKSETDNLVSAPYRRFAIKVLRYKTTPQGTVPPGPLQYWTEIWIVSNEKYRQLRAIIDEWKDVKAHDLTLTCLDAQYQKLMIDVKKDALWMKDKDEMQRVVSYYREDSGKYNLMDCLGQSLSLEQIKNKMSIIQRRFKVESPIDFGDSTAQVLTEIDKVSEKQPSPQVENPFTDDIFGAASPVAPAVETPPQPIVEGAGDVNFLDLLDKEDL
jgi:hypothetical protein